jgi:microcystin-dependent protein
MIIMAKSTPIDPNNPKGTSDPKQGDDQIRKTNAGTIEIINVDHYVGDNTPDIGYQEDAAGEHLKVTLHEQASPVSVAENKGVVFAKEADGIAELFYIDENEAITQVTKNGALVNTYVPVGVVNPYAGNSAPDGWLLCDGLAVSRTTYADLFAVIGTTFGVGDGATTFNKPDMKGRLPIGVGTGDASNATAHTLGQKEGDETHTLTEEEMPAHTHAGPDRGNATVAGGARTVGNTFIATSETGSTGGDAAHNNLQPSLGLNYIIKT